MIKNKTEMERMSDKLIRSLNSRIEELKKQSLPENKYLNKDYLKRMKIENRKLKAGYVRAFEQLKYINNVLRDKLNIDISRKDYFDEIKLAERIKSEIIELSKNEKDNYFNFKSVTSNKFATNKKEFRNLFKATEKMGIGYKVLDRIMELEPSIKTLDSNIRESLVNIINENWTTKSPEEIAKLIQEKLEGFKEGLKVRISDITAAFDGLII